MDFALTEEQRSLQTTVREYLANRFPTSAVRVVYDAPESDAHPVELWKAVGAQGWLAVLVPEEHDGIGLGLLDAAVIARALGAGVAPGPYLPTLLGGEALRLAGSPEQQGKWLPKVAAGEVVLTVALRRDGGSWDATGTGVAADGDTLTGSAAQVEYAQVADRIVVAARTGDTAEEVGLWLVDPAQDGVAVTTHDTLDRTTRLCTVDLDGASGERLPGGDAAVLTSLHARGAVLYAADLVGVARAALSMTVAYDKDRVQFGKAVGSFQAIKHHLADLHTAVTMAEHGVFYAAHALDEGLGDAALMVSVAKAKASDAAREITAATIQYHGGIGYTWEHDAHFYFKRAKRAEHSYGDAGTHRERIARIVVDRETVTV